MWVWSVTTSRGAVSGRGGHGPQLPGCGAPQLHKAPQVCTAHLREKTCRGDLLAPCFLEPNPADLRLGVLGILGQPHHVRGGAEYLEDEKWAQLSTWMALLTLAHPPTGGLGTSGGRCFKGRPDVWAGAAG